MQENEQVKGDCKAAEDAGRIYVHIANALSRDCTDLFYVNMETDEYIEYYTDEERGVLVEHRRDTDFFESCKREAKIYVHAEDQEEFLNAMNREYLTEALDRSRSFEMTYRRIKNGRLFYVQMKVSRMEDDKRFIVIAVKDIDELVMKRREEERIQEERVVYSRLQAITGNYIVIYVVDPETGSYREFSSNGEYSNYFAHVKEGKDFFEKIRSISRQYIYPADLIRFLVTFSKENILTEIEQEGIFTFSFRLMSEGRPLYVQMKAALVEEKEGPCLIIGISDIDEQVRQEKAFERRLVKAQSRAAVDALTGVKNQHAYLDAVVRIDSRIAKLQMQAFAIVMLDINDLKKVNDTYGHQAGDQYLRDACKVICDIFTSSAIYRIGGDEFVVIAQGDDYTYLEDRVELIRKNNEEGLKTGGVVIACGVAEFRDDSCVASVFERADHNMYEDKKRLKLNA